MIGIGFGGPLYYDYNKAPILPETPWRGRTDLEN